MGIKRGVAATLIAGAVGLSGVGLGSGVASAATPGAASLAVAAPTIQTAGWHGRGWDHHGHGFRGFRGYGPAHFPGWHPWGFRHWGWHPW